MPYTEANEKPIVGQASKIVKQFHRNGININSDSCFTDFGLVEELLTCVGAVRKNIQVILEGFTNAKYHSVGASI